jgi:glycosyltransferase involved in cell wall biosynthesis
VYPPVDTEFFTPGPATEARGEYYFTASRFVPYKRIDLIARAFASMPNRQLIIAGTGPDVEKIRAAAGPNVTLVGRVDRFRLRELLRGARAFLFAAEEDFGIVPVEAQACGTPVIAFGKGGACETVNDDTGVFFLDQTSDAIVDAIERFEARESRESRDTAQMCRRNAERFGEARFRAEMAALVEREWIAFSARLRQPTGEALASSG